MELKKILCAVDLMDDANPAVEPAKHFAKLSGASLTVLYILSSSASHLIDAPVEAGNDGRGSVGLSSVEFGNDVGGGGGLSSRNSIMHAIWAHTREDMDRFVAKNFAGMDAEGIIYEGKPAEMIVEVADAIGADMIVMGTHAHEKFLDRFFFGSVANEVLRTAGCLVLTSRPRQKAE